MKRALNRNEIVLLNFVYAAAGDGIYRTNRDDRVLVPLFVGLAMLILVPLLGAFVYMTVTSELQSLSQIRSPADLLANDIFLAIVLPIIGLLVFVIVKLVKFVKESNLTKLVGYLVVPWSQVRAIVITNVRQVGSGLGSGVVYQEKGDWHVFTWDGREIVIPNVDDPYNKLNYVKVRFNLPF